MQIDVVRMVLSSNSEQISTSTSYRGRKSWVTLVRSFGTGRRQRRLLCMSAIGMQFLVFNASTSIVMHPSTIHPPINKPQKQTMEEEKVTYLGTSVLSVQLVRQFRAIAKKFKLTGLRCPSVKVRTILYASSNNNPQSRTLTSLVRSPTSTTQESGTDTGSYPTDRFLAREGKIQNLRVDEANLLSRSCCRFRSVPSSETNQLKTPAGKLGCHDSFLEILQEFEQCFSFLIFVEVDSSVVQVSTLFSSCLFLQIQKCRMLRSPMRW